MEKLQPGLSARLESFPPAAFFCLSFYSGLYGYKSQHRKEVVDSILSTNTKSGLSVLL